MKDEDLFKALKAAKTPEEKEFYRVVFNYALQNAQKKVINNERFVRWF